MANPTYFASKDLFPRGADGSPVPRVRNLRIERFFNSHVSYLTSSTYFSLIDYSHIPPLPPSGASTITTTPAMNLPLSLLLFIFTLTQPSLSVVVDTPDGDSTSYGATDPYDGVDPPEPAPPDDPTRSSSAPARTTTASTSAAPARSPPAAAAPLRGKGDPCGPTYQTDFESTLNTCGQVNTTYTHAPSLFGVQCLHANPSWKQHVNVSSCILNIDNLCGAVIGGLVKASQWYWSSGVCIVPLSSSSCCAVSDTMISDMLNMGIGTGSQLHGRHLDQPHARRATHTVINPMQRQYLRAHGIDLFPIRRQSLQRRGRESADAAERDVKRLTG